MTELHGELRSRTVQRRLPDGWGVENDGDYVAHGWAEPRGEGPGDVPASFTIAPTDQKQVWRAEWCVPDGSRGGLHGPEDSVEGMRERVLQWVADRAEEVDR